MTSIHCSGISVGACASSSSASVSSGNEFHVAHAVFFPRPTNADTVSHPVSAWNTGWASDFADPKQAAIWWAAKYRRCFPVPNAIQTSLSAGSVSATITANTTTSVSTVRTSIWWWSCCAACATCSIIRLSASSWLHGASKCASCCGGTQTTWSPSVTTSSFLSCLNDWTSAFERKLKSSFLLRSTRKRVLPVCWYWCRINNTAAYSFATFCPGCCFERVNYIVVPH